VAPGQLRPSETEAEPCHALAARWILECISTHFVCVSKGGERWSPTRLIDVVHDWPAVEPRLVLSIEFDVPPLYTSLSHLWAAETVLYLMASNQDRMMQTIAMTDLSPTFRDAIMFTRRLGIRNLWIDSLCILQDLMDDCIQQSGCMSRIYRHSVCNIAATAASDGSPRLYQRDPRMVTPCRAFIQRNGHEGTYIFSLRDTHKAAISKAILDQRC
ncbi:hypothetical protein EK21DRAFT_72958, partial [Setomelanomma holmii]